MDRYEQTNDRALLSLEEFRDYLGIGETQARKILKDPNCTFRFFVGNRLYANKKKLDARLEKYDTLI